MSLEGAILSLLNESGVAFKSNARSFVVDCPKCGKKDKLYIDREDGYFICWVCANVDNFKGSKPDYALQVLTGKPVSYIKEILYGINTHFDPSQDELRLRLSEEKLQVVDIGLRPLESVPASYHLIGESEAENGRKYLIARGIPTEIAQQYGLMYSDHERRVLFPVIIRDQIYGYQARTIDRVTDQNIKVLSSRGLKRDRLIMFHDRMLGNEYAMIVEGPIDAIKAHLVGSNVASMGKYITAKQLDLIKVAGIKKLYIGLDEDALSEVPKVARDSGMETFIVRTPPNREDFGDSLPTEVVEQFKKAEPVGAESLFLNLR